MNIKQIIKKKVEGTFLEVPVFALNKWYYHLKYPKLRMGKIYDQQSEIVMKNVLSRNSNCIDVGAHAGDILKLMLKNSPNGKHFAFEPIPELYNALKINYPTVSVHPYALSNQKGTTTFYHVPSNPGFSGLKQRPYFRKDQEVEEINVQIDVLDDIISLDIKIDLIKIDTEGAEYHVMLGAEKIISKWKPFIIFEFEKGVIDKYGTTPEMLFAFIAEKNKMKISTMNKWLKQENSFNKEQFLNAFYTETDFYFIAYP
jgi:FkbM family methyltransferase